MALPDGYALRHPIPDDLRGVKAVFDAAETADTGEPRRHEMDLATQWSDPETHIDTDWWVITGPDGTPAGVAWVYRETEAEITADHAVHPEHRGRGLGDVLLDQIEARAAELRDAAPDGEPCRLSVWCANTDDVRRATLDARGFGPTRQYYEMAVGLRADLPPAAWPEGIVPRVFRPGVDERAVYEADQEAFSEHHLFVSRSFEDWRHWHVEATDADPGLWWLAWEGDELTGFILPFVTDLGVVIGDLAVRKPWRGRGIGRALLAVAFATLRERGATVARLMVDAENVTNAVRVYEAAGMHVSRRFQVMEKQL